MSLYESLLRRTMKTAEFPTWSSLLLFDINNGQNLLPVSAVNFGVKFNMEFGNLWQTVRVEQDKLNVLKSTCRDYLVELLKEMRKRLTSNVHQLELLSQLAPSVVLYNQKPQLQKLSFIGIYNGDLNKLNIQGQAFSTVEWTETDD